VYYYSLNCWLNATGYLFLRAFSTTANALVTHVWLNQFLYPGHLGVLFVWLILIDCAHASRHQNLTANLFPCAPERVAEKIHELRERIYINLPPAQNILAIAHTKAPTATREKLCFISRSEAPIHLKSASIKWWNKMESKF
jgi:hypothetical protein